MNTYLAVLHLFSLLEQPISIEDFTEKTKQNPLFENACMQSRQLIWFLYDETIIEKSERGFKLAPEGEQLYQYLLNWTARDKEKIRQSNIESKAKSGKGPVNQNCPKCASKKCVLHIVIIVLEHFYLERPERQRLTNSARQDLLSALQNKWPNHKLYCLWESNPVPHWPDWTDEHCEKALSSLTDISYPHFKRELALIPKRQLIRTTSSPLELVSRLRYENGLLAYEQQALLDTIEQGQVTKSLLIRWSMPIYLERFGMYCLFKANHEFMLLTPHDFQT